MVTGAVGSAGTHVHVDPREGKGLVVRRLVRRVAVELAQSPVVLDGEEWRVQVVETSQGGLVGALHQVWVDEQSHVSDLCLASTWKGSESQMGISEWMVGTSITGKTLRGVRTGIRTISRAIRRN